MLASLRENSVQKCITDPIRNYNDALLFGATHQYLEERNVLFEQMRAHGIVTIDEVAKELPVALTNAYLEVKNSGRL